MVVRLDDRSFPFAADALTGGLRIELASGPVVVRPLLWGERVRLARLAALDISGLEVSLATLATGFAPATEEDAAVIATLAAWLDQPAGGGLDVAALADGALAVSRATGWSLAEMDARPAAEIDGFARLVSPKVDPVKGVEPPFVGPQSAHRGSPPAASAPASRPPAFALGETRIDIISDPDVGTISPLEAKGASDEAADAVTAVFPADRSLRTRPGDMRPLPDRGVPRSDAQDAGAPQQARETLDSAIAPERSEIEPPKPDRSAAPAPMFRVIRPTNVAPKVGSGRNNRPQSGLGADDLAGRPPSAAVSVTPEAVRNVPEFVPLSDDDLLRRPVVEPFFLMDQPTVGLATQAIAPVPEPLISDSSEFEAPLHPAFVTAAVLPQVSAPHPSTMASSLTADDVIDHLAEALEVTARDLGFLEDV